MKEGQEKTLIDQEKPQCTKKKSAAKNFFLYFSAVTACLVSFTAGILWVWTSPVLPKLDGSVDPASNPLGRPITTAETSWIAGTASLGSFISPLMAGRMSDKIGRKKSLLVIACPMLLALLVAAFSSNVLQFCFARFCMGLGTGGVLTVLAMYLGEIAENDNRGKIISLNSFFTSFGMLFTYVVGPFLSVRNFCLICTIPLIVFMSVFSSCVPESPYFLALVEDQDGLRKSLAKLRKSTKEETEEELSRITSNVEKKIKTRSTFSDLFKSKVSRKALFLTLNVVLLQIFCGSNVILTYMQTIFAASRSKIDPKYCPIIVASVQTSMILFSSSLVDRLGRRFLLLLSLAGCSLCLVALGTYFHLQRNGVGVDVIFWLPVASLLAYFIFLSVGLRPVPFILQTEMFAPHVKASASVVASLARSVGNFSTTWCFPLVSASLGMAGSFWIFAVICLVGALAVFWTLPETKGKSFDEIQRILERKGRQDR